MREGEIVQKEYCQAIGCYWEHQMHNLPLIAISFGKFCMVWKVFAGASIRPKVCSVV